MASDDLLPVLWRAAQTPAVRGSADDVARAALGAISGGAEAAGTAVTRGGNILGRAWRGARNLPRFVRWGVPLVAAGGGAILAARNFSAEEPEEGYSFELGRPTMTGGMDTAVIRDLMQQRRDAAARAGGGGADYSGMRQGFRDWAGTLRGYGAGQTEALGREYGALAERAAQDAAQAEALGRLAYEDIGRIGSGYATQATQDITTGLGGPTETTGLVPVSGELTDIPGRIADTSQIAADYVLRDLNLTRDDLAYMGNVARMMGPAYAAQLNNTINMAVANRKFELDQSIAAQQAADRRAAAAAASAADVALLDQLIALEQMSQGQQNMFTPELIRSTADTFQAMLDNPQDRQALAAAGINVDNPNVGFQQYLQMQVRGAASAGR